MTISDKKVKIPQRINLSRLAMRTGYSLSHLSRVFAGYTTPSMKCIRQMATVLSLSIAQVDEIIGERVLVRKKAERSKRMKEVRRDNETRTSRV